MFTLFGPILAQVVTVAVGDRSEARVVVNDTTEYEAANRPSVGVGMAWRRFTLQLAYSPSFTV
jgi:hypothetical protein